jgi:hypothetical protein
MRNASAAATRPRILLRGSVSFEVRSPTPRGASAALALRPARGIEIAALDREGREIARGATDASGAFAFEAPADAFEFEVRALSRDGFDIAVTRDPGGQRPHRARLRIAETPQPFAIVVRDAELPLAGALHVLDTMRRGLEAVREWTGVILPPVYAYWDRGVTREWSYYRGERPEGSGRFCIELLGGDPGLRESTDTDEHDEAIVLHELGHFVMDRLAGHSSLGGQHPRGVLLDPGLAWEEGRATWFATAVLGAPHYQDTIGIEPHGTLRVDETLERPQPPRGIGSETSVAGVLWDLADGNHEAGSEGEGERQRPLPDEDRDGIALGPARVLRAMIALAATSDAFPSLPGFLRFLVSSDEVPETALREMLTRTGEPASLLPATGAALWPLDLEVDGSATGKIDGLSQPAPNGGANRPDVGFDAIRAYRVRVARRGMLVARLTIYGSGTQRDRTNLDLELRDSRARLLDAARSRGAREAVARVVDPGVYIVYVRDAGDGNRADYQLDLTFNPF